MSPSRTNPDRQGETQGATFLRFIEFSVVEAWRIAVRDFSLSAGEIDNRSKKERGPPGVMVGRQHDPVNLHFEHPS
jgi:hypothetical protein